MLKLDTSLVKRAINTETWMTRDLLVTAYVSAILGMSACVLQWWESAHVKTHYKLKIVLCITE